MARSPCGLLEGQQHAGLAEVAGTAHQELDAEQGLAGAGRAGDQGRATAGKTAAGDLVEAGDAGAAPSPGRPSLRVRRHVPRVLTCAPKYTRAVSPAVPVGAVSARQSRACRDRIEGLHRRRKAPDETPAFAFPLRTQKRLIEGLFWAATLVSETARVNAWSRPGVPEAVQVTHRLWITLWTECGGPALCCGSHPSGQNGR